jgi:hypothetical protein
MGDGPVVDLSQVIFVDQFGESLAPVVPDLLGCGGASGYEFGEMRDEIVTATLEEFGGEGEGPVSSVGFEGVGEYGVGWGVAEGFDERLADLLKVGGDGLAAERIEDVAFGSDRGSLDDLFGVARDEEEGYARFVGGSDGDGGAGESKRLGGGGVPSERWRRRVVTARRSGGRSTADAAIFKSAMNEMMDSPSSSAGGRATRA